MIKLRPMLCSEYPAYCDYFIDDYSHEIAENYGHSIDKSVALARQELLRCFPKGLTTDEHQLLCIDLDSELVGYLWHSQNTSNKSTFIYDFFIFTDKRSNGYGRLAIAALESQLKLAGIEQIKLRVAYQNKRALALYKEVGFVISGYNMSKNIS